MSKRPTSASSRTAWGDYGHARPDNQFDFGQEGIRDDPDLNATAMEDDYMGDTGKGKSKSVVPATGTKSSKSCFAKIGGGIRSLWATRQTEDVKGDRELHVKTTLRELIVYIVFLVILCVVTFGMTTTTMYYYTKVMSDLFLDTQAPSGVSFRTITSVEDFWKFAKSPLIKGLYWETWYNNQTMPADQLGYIYYENKLLGVPRIRQLQVHRNSCVVHEDFKALITECYEAYADSLENKDPFGPQDMNYTAWFYRSEEDLDGSSHWGLLTTYSGAGYVEDLTQNKTESDVIINYLFDNRWIVRGTRVVFIDFTVYNANINLFCVIRLTVEFPPTGGAIPHATLRTVKLIRYVTVTDYFIMACEFIFCLFIIYYMIEEGIEIKKHKFAYFKSFWNILDILVISIAIVCVAFNIYRTLKVDELLSDLLDKPDQYADFEFLSYGQTQFDNAIAIAVFLAWIKIFKYISFNKTMTQLSSTLGKCAKDLAGFAVMFFIIFLAFTQLGYLLFGTQVKDFSNFQNSFFTLFRIILGDFDFEQLEQAHRVLGPIFFMLFVFFVFFVLINMFLAIINDTYSEVKGDMANQKNEFEMTDYFKRGYEKMISKLNFKHDKIVDIQKALKSADLNNDKQLDFDEWRTDLKMRGYADGEIEALFARYDVDGDRVLDEDEQNKMQADLAKQKDALNKEYDELEKIPRPNSKISYNDDSAEDSDDEDSRTKSSRSGPSQSVSYEEFTVLSRRVDRMEHSIGSIVSKIDAVLVKLEAMEKAKLKRRETMGKILDSITESDGTSDEVKREQMERLVREELERWDSESSITPQPSGRGASPSSSGRGGARSRSRPGSGNANIDKYTEYKDQDMESPEPPPILVAEMPKQTILVSPKPRADSPRLAADSPKLAPDSPRPVAADSPSFSVDSPNPTPETDSLLQVEPSHWETWSTDAPHSGLGETDLPDPCLGAIGVRHSFAQSHQNSPSGLGEADMPENVQSPVVCVSYPNESYGVTSLTMSSVTSPIPGTLSAGYNNTEYNQSAPLTTAFPPNMDDMDETDNESVDLSEYLDPSCDLRQESEETFSAEVSPPLVGYQTHGPDSSVGVSNFRYSQRRNSCQNDNSVEDSADPTVNFSQGSADPEHHKSTEVASGIAPISSRQATPDNSQYKLDNSSVTNPVAPDNKEVGPETKHTPSNDLKHKERKLTTGKGQRVSVGTLSKQVRKTHDDDKRGGKIKDLSPDNRVLSKSSKTNLDRTNAKRALDNEHTANVTILRQSETEATKCRYYAGLIADCETDIKVTPEKPVNRKKKRSQPDQLKQASLSTDTTMVKPPVPPKPRPLPTLSTCNETKPTLPPRAPLIQADPDPNIAISVKPAPLTTPLTSSLTSPLTSPSTVCELTGRESLEARGVVSGSRNKVSVQPSCKTPVMETLTTSVFV